MFDGTFTATKCSGDSWINVFNHELQYIQLTYLTPWNGGLHENLTAAKMDQDSTSWGIRMSIILFTTAPHLSLSSTRWIKCIPYYPSQYSRAIHTTVSQTVSTLQVFDKILCAFLISPKSITHPVHLNLIIFIIFGEEYRSRSSSSCNYLQSHLHLCYLFVIYLTRLVVAENIQSQMVG